MLRYKSDFPNQVHQLNVSLSKHYFLLNDGSIKWQAKELDINWTNLEKTQKKHLVTYIIRDHFSNCFYAELHSIDKMPSIHEFLFNAWTRKLDYDFYGLPDCLIVPKTTQEQFPSIRTFFSKFDNPYLQTPTSGFSSAAVSIRQWERFIKFFTGVYKNWQTLAQFQENIALINKETNAFVSRDRQDSNLQKWRDNNPQIIEIGNKEQFYKLFD
ncbi:MAG: hypothetical protein JNK14_03455 [Chitinophagaceae bacterium]|nr:hypothetical protein [Chitinophagaceae bacterium]